MPVTPVPMKTSYPGDPLENEVHRLQRTLVDQKNQVIETSKKLHDAILAFNKSILAKAKEQGVVPVEPTLGPLP